MGPEMRDNFAMCWYVLRTSKQKITQALEIITNGCLKPLGRRVAQRSEMLKEFGVLFEMFWDFHTCPRAIEMFQKPSGL